MMKIDLDDISGQEITAYWDQLWYNFCSR